MGKPVLDLAHQRFGRLLVLVEAPRLQARRWLCRCDCGQEIVVRQQSLRSGNTQSCGCLGRERLREGADASFQDISGQRFGRLLVLRYVPEQGRRGKWSCRCDCGRVRLVRPDCLFRGSTRSCGCLSADRTRETHFTHGHTTASRRSPEYQSWANMISRVDDKKGRNFFYYGARGITVCERWRTFENFLADMGPRPPGTSLDRVDNNGHYEPGNCRWATRSQQLLNRRSKTQCAVDNARAMELLRKEEKQNAA